MIETVNKIAEMTAKTETVMTTLLFVNNILFTSKITMISASRLFKKCAKIGTNTLSVFRYRIAMHIEKTNAAIMLP